MECRSYHQRTMRLYRLKGWCGRSARGRDCDETDTIGRAGDRGHRRPRTAGGLSALRGQSGRRATHRRAGRRLEGVGRGQQRLRHRPLQENRREVEGEVRIPAGKSFGFLGDVFVHPSMVTKRNITNGMHLKGVSLKAYNPEKKQWGWKLFNISQ